MDGQKMIRRMSVLGHQRISALPQTHAVPNTVAAKHLYGPATASPKGNSLRTQVFDPMLDFELVNVDEMQWVLKWGLWWRRNMPSAGIALFSLMIYTCLLTAFWTQTQALCEGDSEEEYRSMVSRLICFLSLQQPTSICPDDPAVLNSVCGILCSWPF